MMKRKDFYNIALYGNDTWNGAYSAREVMNNACAYYADYLWCIRNRKVTQTIWFLIDQMAYDYADGEKQVIPWLKTMVKELHITKGNATLNDFIKKEVRK